MTYRRLSHLERIRQERAARHEAFRKALPLLALTYISETIFLFAAFLARYPPRTPFVVALLIAAALFTFWRKKTKMHPMHAAGAATFGSMAALPTAFALFAILQ